MTDKSSERLVKELIDSCNDFIWVHAYPYRQNFKMLGTLQHRDLVRTFLAGAMEMLMLINDRETVVKLLMFYAEISQENWMPDMRFHYSNVIDKDKHG